MKKLLKHFCVFALVFAIAISGNSAIFANASSYTETAYQGLFYGRVTAVDGLYVYTKPDTTSTRKDGGVSYNWEVQCLTYTSNGFTKIRYYYGSKDNTFVGYVRSQYLEVKKYDKVPTKDTETFTNIYGYVGTTTASRLNVHSSINFDGNDKKIFTVIKKGTVVSIIAKSKSWYKVYFTYKNKKKVGYISRSYVKVSDAMNNLTVAIPKGTFSSSTKYKLKVTDPTKPYALSKTINWTSSKKSVATVSSSGVVKAKNPGKTTITAKVKVGDRTKKIKVKITVKEYFTLQ